MESEILTLDTFTPMALYQAVYMSSVTEPTFALGSNNYKILKIFSEKDQKYAIVQVEKEAGNSDTVCKIHLYEDDIETLQSNINLYEKYSKEDETL